MEDNEIQDKGYDVPRFALTIVDTHTTLDNGADSRYLSLSIGADHLADFTRQIPKDKRRNQGTTEFEAMVMFFAEQVAKADQDTKEGNDGTYTEVKLD